DDGLSYGDYVEQLTFLLFLKMADERTQLPTYDELAKRDKLNLDIFWLKDDTLEDRAHLPDPDVIAREIAEDLRSALEQFEALAEEPRK
ncbi:MAG TPA: hypothetical protein VMN03_16875, partial [Burkholderiales bacterium]|nr:hypothetical protein [Burkholderiales bacterium]